MSRARIGQQVLQGLVHRAVVAQAGVGVEVDEETPQRGVRLPRGGHELDDPHHLLLRAVQDVPAHLPARLGVHGEPQRRPAALTHPLPVGRPRPPEPLRPVHPPGPVPPGDVVGLLQQRQRLLPAQQPDRPVTEIGAGPQRHEPLVPPDLGHLAGHPVPEPPVDRRLGRVERRDRFAARLVQAGELLAHHRGEDAAAPVRRQHRHQRDPGDGYRRAGDRHDAPVDGGAADDVPAVEGGQRATGIEGDGGVPEAALDPVLAVRRGDHASPRVDLVGGDDPQRVSRCHAS